MPVTTRERPKDLPPHKYAETTNPLRAWFSQFPKPMSQLDFAILLGVSPSYVTALSREEDPPWPSREVALKIAELTQGEVTPNDLAGWKDD